MTAPNIVNVGVIRGQKSVKADIGLETQVVVFNSPDSSKVYRINNIVATNVDGTNTVDATVDVTKNNTAYSIIKTITVPPDSSLVLLSKNSSIYLEESMAIRATASANNDLEISCAYEEIGTTTDSDSLVDYKNYHPAPLNIFDGWATGVTTNNCTIAADAATGKSPLAGIPLKMSVSGNDSHIGTYNSSTWNIAPAEDTQTWRVKVWCKANTSSVAMQIFIFGVNSSGSWLNAGGDVGSTSFVTTTSWAEYSSDFTFSNATVAYIQIRLDGSNTAGNELWFDYLQVYRIS